MSRGRSESKRPPKLQDTLQAQEQAQRIIFESWPMVRFDMDVNLCGKSAASHLSMRSSLVRP